MVTATTNQNRTGLMLLDCDTTSSSPTSSTPVAVSASRLLLLLKSGPNGDDTGNLLLLHINDYSLAAGSRLLLLDLAAMVWLLQFFLFIYGRAFSKFWNVNGDRIIIPMNRRWIFHLLENKSLILNSQIRMSLKISILIFVYILWSNYY